MVYIDTNGTNATDIEYSTESPDGTYVEITYVVATTENPFEAPFIWGGFSHGKSIEERMIEWRAKMASFNRYPRNIFKTYTGGKYKQTRRKHLYRRYIPN